MVKYSRVKKSLRNVGRKRNTEQQKNRHKKYIRHRKNTKQRKSKKRGNTIRRRNNIYRKKKLIGGEPEITIQLNVGEKPGIKFVGNYPFITEFRHGSLAEQRGISVGMEIIKVNGLQVPDNMEELSDIMKYLQTRQAYTLTFAGASAAPRAAPPLSKDYNITSVTGFKGWEESTGGRQLYTSTCPNNYIEGFEPITIESIPQGLFQQGENLGEDDDHFALNPRQVGFDGIPGEVLFIPTDYVIYKGAGPGDPASHFPCDYSLDYPQWYSDKKIADLYIGPESQMMVYKTKKPLVLINLIDHMNIKWILEKISDSGESDDVKEGFIGCITRAAMNQDYHLNNKIWGDGRIINDIDSLPYITFCGKKYGKKRDPDEPLYDEDVVNRYSQWPFPDIMISNILELAFEGINCDGYFTDSIPNVGGIFHREIMLINPSVCLNIDESNRYHTCVNPHPNPVEAPAVPPVEAPAVPPVEAPEVDMEEEDSL